MTEVPRIELCAGIHSDEREHWLAERRKTIGASEVPTVLGLNPWETPLQLALRKQGRMPEKDETEAMNLGSRLEPVIVQLWEEETGRQTLDLGPFTIQRNDSYPFLGATLDREALPCDDHPMPGVLECKAPGAHMLDQWDGGVPLYVQAQCQAQMAVTGMDWASVAALIGGQRFLWADLVVNNDFIAFMVSKVEQFWAIVQRGDLPEPTADDVKAIKYLYPDHVPEKVVELPVEAIALVDALEENAIRLKSINTVVTEGENRLKMLIGDAEIGILPNGVRYSYKTSQRKGYTVEPTKVRTLRRLKK